MANQYEGNFEDIIKKKFNCTAVKVLQECVNEGLSYTGAAKKLGFAHGTIRKWTRRFGLKLKAGEPPRLETEDFFKSFNDRKINQHNILSRSWLQSNGTSLHLSMVAICSE
jgi:hypothetical protein